jgi:dihydrofolate reductase
MHRSKEIPMSNVVCDMAMSVDGFVAGPNQSHDNPLGEGVGDSLHAWMFDEPEKHEAERAAIVDAGAFVMGRNMFGPDRGDWDLDWKGWWGDEPPYHGPVFVLTHHERDPLEMHGGTTFHFVTGGIESALAQAREAAGPDRNVAIAGGASTVRQYLAAGAIAELRLHVAPVIMGEGESLFSDGRRVELELLGTSGTELVTHHRYRVVR